MKKVIIITTAAITILLAACNHSATKTDAVTSNSATPTFQLDTTQLKAGDSFYQCEMHPEVLSDKAGQCPKCGMELVEMKKH